MDWPHRYLTAEAEAGRIVDARTVIAVLTHDPKFDVPLLEVALRLPEAAYVGAMGSRRTHDDRLERLREGAGWRTGRSRGSPARSASTSAPGPRGDRDQHQAAEIVAGRVGRVGRAALGDGGPHPPLSPPLTLLREGGPGRHRGVPRSPA